MAIIVDTNSTHLLFNGDEAGTLVWQGIVDGDLIYITGGRHKDEVLNGGMKREVYSQLLLAGKIRVYAKDECAEDSAEILGLKLRSDDPHIIALALRSGCRLVYTHDAMLCKGFKDKNIIDNPRGKIFQRKTHGKLLKNTPNPRV